MSQWAGAVVGGRFQLLGQIAVGGMGTVHRAHDMARQRAVAVKLVTDLALPDAIERFRREAEILAQLRHPGIVEFVDAGSLPAGGMYLAMQWLEGIDLAARLVAGPIGCAAAVRLVRNVAEALSVAHDRGVLHRDVKPQNVFLREGDLGSPVLLDFGIATLAGLSVGITRTGISVGTPSYMAPEQARGERNLDPRVDVYGLGCLLFQCVTGGPPFAGPSPVAVVADVLLSPAPRLSARSQEVPEPLCDLVASMLAKRPADRPRDGRDVAERLLAIESSLELPTSSRMATVSADERRMIALLGVMQPAAPPSKDAGATMPMRGTFLPRLARELGGDLRVLPGGAALISFTSEETISEAAARAASTALLALRSDPLLSFGLTVGPSQVGVVPDGEIVQRVAGLSVAPGKVLIDDAARKVLADRFVIEAEPEGLSLLSARGESDASSRQVKFVGREREIAALCDAFEAVVEQGVARTVMVTGAQGLGKSRLLRELFVRLVERSPTPFVLDVRAEPGQAERPLSLVGLLVRRGLILVEGADPDEQLSLLRSALAPLVEPTREPRVAAFLALVLGLPVPTDAPSPELLAAARDPQVFEDQVCQALVLVLGALASHQAGLVLMIDDAQWVDTISARVLLRIVRALREKPLLVVSFARPEVDAKLLPSPREVPHERIQLGALSKKSAERFLEHALGSRATGERIAKIVQQAEGNPLFLSELASFSTAAAADTGSLVPSSVLASLEARLLRLDATARKVLRAASVFGERFWRGGVAALLGEATPEGRTIDEWLRFLIERDMIEPSPTTRFAGETELSFRHSLLRGAAYEMLTADDRIRGHRRAAAWLTEAGEREPAVLAEHYDAAHEQASAATEWALAATVAHRRNDAVRAAQCCERALDRGLSGAERTRTLVMLAESLTWTAEYERALEFANQAAASALVGTQGWVDACSTRIAVLVRLDEQSALDATRALVEAVRADPGLAPSASALTHPVTAALRRGKHAFAEEILKVLGEAALRSAPGDPSVYAQLLRCRSWQAMFNGDFARCAKLDGEALEYALRAGDQRQVATSRFDIAYDLRMLGDYELAVQYFLEARDDARELGLDALVSTIEHNLSLALHRIGRHREAIDMQHRCVDKAILRGDRIGEAYCRHYMGVMRHEAGALDLAELELERAIASLDTSTIRWEALARLGLIALERQNLQLASLRIEEAARGVLANANSEEGDMLIRLAKIKLYQARGDRVAAQTETSQAHAFLLAQAALIPDERLRQTFLSRAPVHREICELFAQQRVA